MIRWIKARAKWWQFWMPQSGLTGGIIAGWIITLIIIVGAYFESR